MKPSTILITSLGVPKLVPEGTKIPEKPCYCTGFKTNLCEDKLADFDCSCQVDEEKYTTDFIALEKEAESWPEFEKKDYEDLFMWMSYSEVGKFAKGEVSEYPDFRSKPPKPSIYKEVMIPKHSIVWQSKSLMDTSESWEDHQGERFSEGKKFEYRQIIRFLPETEQPFIEPIALKAGDERLKINGVSPKVDCRVISEDQYQRLIGGSLPSVSDEETDTYKSIYGGPAELITTAQFCPEMPMSKKMAKEIENHNQRLRDIALKIKVQFESMRTRLSGETKEQKPNIYAGELNTERIKTYQRLAEEFNIDPGTVGYIFSEGANWGVTISRK